LARLEPTAIVRTASVDCYSTDDLVSVAVRVLVDDVAQEVKCMFTISLVERVSAASPTTQLFDRSGVRRALFSPDSSPTHAAPPVAVTNSSATVNVEAAMENEAARSRGRSNSHDVSLTSDTNAGAVPVANTALTALMTQAPAASSGTPAGGSRLVNRRSSEGSEGGVSVQQAVADGSTSAAGTTLGAGSSLERSVSPSAADPLLNQHVSPYVTPTVPISHSVPAGASAIAVGASMTTQAGVRDRTAASDVSLFGDDRSAPFSSHRATALVGSADPPSLPFDAAAEAEVTLVVRVGIR